MNIIFGIGNPGNNYYYTYHNIGLLFNNFLLKNFNHSIIKNTEKYDFFLVNDFYILNSKVYMNCSFDALREVYFFYKLSNENLLVVHDELGLAKYKVRIKKTDGLNGHNGLRNIANYIGAKFPKLQFGIDHPKNFNPNIDVSSYVLSKLTIKEWENSFNEGLNLIYNQYND